MIKRLLAALFLLALGIAIGVGWFKFGPTYESKTVEQYVGAQPGDVVLPKPAPAFPNSEFPVSSMKNCLNSRKRPSR